MFALIVLIIFGIGVALFATQNTQSTSITLVSYPLRGIPMYMVVLISLLFGFFVSWIMSLFDFVSSAFKMHGKDSKLNTINKENAQLNERIHELELENEKLKAKNNAKK